MPVGQVRLDNGFDGVGVEIPIRFGGLSVFVAVWQPAASSDRNSPAERQVIKRLLAKFHFPFRRRPQEFITNRQLWPADVKGCQNRSAPPGFGFRLCNTDGF